MRACARIFVCMRQKEMNESDEERSGRMTKKEEQSENENGKYLGERKWFDKEKTRERAISDVKVPGEK